jgi:hypothetical protein
LAFAALRNGGDVSKIVNQAVRVWCLHSSVSYLICRRSC